MTKGHGAPLFRCIDGASGVIARVLPQGATSPAMGRCYVDESPNTLLNAQSSGDSITGSGHQRRRAASEIENGKLPDIIYFLILHDKKAFQMATGHPQR